MSSLDSLTDKEVYENNSHLTISYPGEFSKTPVPSNRSPLSKYVCSLEISNYGNSVKI